MSKKDVLDGLREYFNTPWHEPTQPGDQPDMSLKGTILHTHQYALAATQEMAGLRAAVNKLADAVAKGGGASAADLKAAVASAIQENVVQVDVEVKGAGA